MANLYDIGDLARVTNGTFTVSGAATDPTTVTLKVKDPSGNIGTYTYALSQVTKSSTGVYYKDISLDEAGVWWYEWAGTGTCETVTSGYLVVQEPTMATTTVYATVAEFKAHYYPAGATDTVDDAILAGMLEAVSRWIDAETNRRFYASATDEARYFTARDGGHVVPAEDIVSITTLQTDDDGDGVYETTWLGTDWELRPRNAGLDGQPYLEIWTTPAGTKTFPTMANAVKATGKFGYCEIKNLPEMVRQACLRETERQFKLKDAPFGISGPTELGTQTVVPTLDPGVRLMLRPFRKIPYRRG